jgi:hypothetical protein
LLLLNVVVWGYLSLSGYYGVEGVAQQRVAGYPNAGQIYYYLYVPFLLLLISTLWPLGFWRASAWIRNSVPVVALALCPLFLFFYTGGM